MIYSESQLEQLEAALARGEHCVAFDRQLVEYGSVQKLEAVIREARHELQPQVDLAGLGPRRARTLP